MIILIHVLIAISSVTFSTLALLKPSIKKLYIGYGLMVATVGSGTYLILVSSSASILKSCLVGVAYVMIVSAITVATHLKIARVSRAKQATEIQ